MGGWKVQRAGVGGAGLWDAEEAKPAALWWLGGMSWKAFLMCYILVLFIGFLVGCKFLVRFLFLCFLQEDVSWAKDGFLSGLVQQGEVVVVLFWQVVGLCNSSRRSKKWLWVRSHPSEDPVCWYFERTLFVGWLALHPRKGTQFWFWPHSQMGIVPGANNARDLLKSQARIELYRPVRKGEKHNFDLVKWWFGQTNGRKTVVWSPKKRCLSHKNSQKARCWELKPTQVASFGRRTGSSASKNCPIRRLSRRSTRPLLRWPLGSLWSGLPPGPRGGERSYKQCKDMRNGKWINKKKKK